MNKEITCAISRQDNIGKVSERPGVHTEVRISELYCKEGMILKSCIHVCTSCWQFLKSIHKTIRRQYIFLKINNREGKICDTYKHASLIIITIAQIAPWESEPRCAQKDIISVHSTVLYLKKLSD